MKTLAEKLENLEVLNEIEMNNILGGCTGVNSIEDEDCWLAY